MAYGSPIDTETKTGLTPLAMAVAAKYDDIFTRVSQNKDTIFFLREMVE